MLRFGLGCVVLAAFVSSASAQAPKPIRLWLTPAKPPTPALRYQLLPDARITTSGSSTCSSASKSPPWAAARKASTTRRCRVMSRSGCGAGRRG